MDGLINLIGNLQKLIEVRDLPDSQMVTFALISLAAIILIASAIKKKGSLGVMLVALLIFVAARLGLTSLAQIGFVVPENWLRIVLVGLLIGSGLSLLNIMLIGPLIENFTKQPHDVSIVDGVRGNWKSLLSWLALIWTFAAFGEELLYRGFLMSQLTKLMGTSLLAFVLNVLFTSIVFGLSHSYQGRSGVWSTGIIGVFLGVIYILNGFNLWLPIVVHGAIDTFELLLMFLGADRRLRELLWKKQLQPAA